MPTGGWPAPGGADVEAIVKSFSVNDVGETPGTPVKERRPTLLLV